MHSLLQCNFNVRSTIYSIPSPSLPVPPRFSVVIHPLPLFFRNRSLCNENEKICDISWIAFLFVSIFSVWRYSFHPDGSIPNVYTNRKMCSRLFAIYWVGMFDLLFFVFKFLVFYRLPIDSDRFYYFTSSSLYRYSFLLRCAITIFGIHFALKF